MMTRYFAATTALLIYTTVETSDQEAKKVRKIGNITITCSAKPTENGKPIRKSARLAEKEDSDTLETAVPVYKTPEAYTAQSQSMSRKNGQQIIKKGRKKSPLPPSPSIKTEKSDIHEATCSSSRSWRNYILGNSAGRPIEIDGEVEEEVTSFSSLFNQSALPSEEEPFSTSSSLSTLPSASEEMDISSSLPVLPLITVATVNNTVESRDSLLTVSDGRVTKPRKKGRYAASRSKRASLPTLRARSAKRIKKRTVTKELLDETSQLNAAIETMKANNQPLDPQAERWYAITKDVKPGDFIVRLPEIEADKFKIKEWLNQHIKGKYRQ